MLDDWRIHQLYDWDWLDADGAVLKKVANKTAYEAVMTKYADLGCYSRKAQLGCPRLPSDKIIGGFMPLLFLKKVG